MTGLEEDKGLEGFKIPRKLSYILIPNKWFDSKSVSKEQLQELGLEEVEGQRVFKVSEKLTSKQLAFVWLSLSEEAKEESLQDLSQAEPWIHMYNVDNMSPNAIESLKKRFEENGIEAKLAPYSKAERDAEMNASPEENFYKHNYLLHNVKSTPHLDYLSTSTSIKDQLETHGTLHANMVLVKEGEVLLMNFEEPKSADEANERLGEVREYCKDTSCMYGKLADISVLEGELETLAGTLAELEEDVA